jgi:hypothetical protein
VPSGVSLDNAVFSFGIGEGVALKGSHDLYTTDPTTISAKVTETCLSITAAPPLRIRPFSAWWNFLPLIGQGLYFGFSDIEFSGLQYDFASATITGMTMADTGPGISEQDKARQGFTEWFDSVVQGTPVATAGYDPPKDPDLQGTVAKLQANLSSGGDGGGGLTTNDLSAVDTAVTATFTDEFRHIDEKGQGVVIPAGTPATLHVKWSGTLADLADPFKRKIQNLEIDCEPGIQLLNDNQAVAALKRVYVNNGGAVTLGGFEPLGALSSLQGITTFLGFLGGTAQAGSLGGGVGAQKGAEMGAFMDRDMITNAITPAVRQLIVANRAVIPGLDIAALMGMG